MTNKPVKTFIYVNKTSVLSCLSVRLRTPLHEFSLTYFQNSRITVSTYFQLFSPILMRRGYECDASIRPLTFSLPYMTEISVVIRQ